MQRPPHCRIPQQQQQQQSTSTAVGYEVLTRHWYILVTSLSADIVSLLTHGVRTHRLLICKYCCIINIHSMYACCV